MCLLTNQNGFGINICSAINTISFALDTYNTPKRHNFAEFFEEDSCFILYTANGKKYQIF